MIHYAFSIDLDLCLGCQACVVACKTGNEVPLGNTYITITESVRGRMPALTGTFLHHRCFHCEDAACVTVCPTGTLSKWNGLTTVTPEKCSGDGYCTDACPYKVPKLVNGRVTKCVACLDLVREGKMPWCVRTCPSQAIKFGKRNDLLSIAKVRVAKIKARYPNAQIYGETQFGGLNLLIVMPDKPQVFGLPDQNRVSQLLTTWQSIIQPFSLGISALSVIVTGFMFIFARRRHLSEQANLNATKENDQIAEEPVNIPKASKPMVHSSSQPALSSVSRSKSRPVSKSASQGSKTSASKSVRGSKTKPLKPQKTKDKRNK